MNIKNKIYTYFNQNVDANLINYVAYKQIFMLFCWIA